MRTERTIEDRIFVVEAKAWEAQHIRVSTSTRFSVMSAFRWPTSSAVSLTIISDLQEQLG
jgi:hypothetical protein